VRVFVSDQEKGSPNIPHFVIWRSWRLWPRRTCGFELCVIFAGTSKGHAGPRVLKGTHCKCCGTRWSCGIDSSENLSLRWRQGREQVVRISKQFSRVCDCLSLSQLTCVYILLAHIVHIIICLIFTYT